MKFLLLNGTLKVDSELSNTFTLCQMVKAGFEALGHECELVTLSEMEYKKSTDDVKDDLQPVIQKMFSRRFDICNPYMVGWTFIIHTNHY